jgi:uncharacterized protein (DUF111 family)
VDTPSGSIRVKVARWGDIERAAPEYEDCRRAAEEQAAPLMAVIEAARIAWQRHRLEADG